MLDVAPLTGEVARAIGGDASVGFLGCVCGDQFGADARCHEGDRLGPGVDQPRKEFRCVLVERHGWLPEGHGAVRLRCRVRRDRFDAFFPDQVAAEVLDVGRGA